MNHKETVKIDWVVLDGENLAELLREAADIIEQEKLEPQVFVARLYGWDWRLSFPGRGE